MAPRHPALAHNEERLTTLGPTVVVRGRIEGGESVRIEGRVEGSIAVDDTIFVTNAAIVVASLHARQVVVDGIVVGDIEAEFQVVLKATARVLGNIRAPRIHVIEGASMRGEMDMGEFTPDAERGGQRALGKGLASRPRSAAIPASGRESAPARVAAPAASTRARASHPSNSHARANASSSARNVNTRSATPAAPSSRGASRRPVDSEPAAPIHEPFRGRDLDEEEAEYELNPAEGEGDEVVVEEGEREAVESEEAPAQGRQAQPRMPARGKQRIHQR